MSRMINRVANWVGSKYVLSGLLVLVAVGVFYVRQQGTTENVTNDAVPAKPLVTTTTPAAYAGEQSLSIIGTARAFSEANIVAERGGRVTAVSVELGKKVGAGAVIATLENASERAAVLQAEGVYDAALAATAQSDVGVGQAEDGVRSAQESVISTLRSSYNTTYGVVVTNIDQFFSNPNSPLPGLRVGGQGYTQQLNAERVAYQDLLPNWQQQVNTISVDDDLFAALDQAVANVNRTIEIIDIFLYIFDRRDDDGDRADGYEQEFTTARSLLLQTITSLEAARTSLQSALDAEKRAKLSASGGTSSAADAQVKQALGALRAAQANLAKTIVRSSISGVVNSLEVRTGDFVSANQPIAVVANNDALEIVAYLNDSERALLAIDDTVMIDDVTEGMVVNMAPAVDSATGKTEVRIAAEGKEIVNGDTVRITKKIARDEETISAIIEIPLTAIKFDAKDGSVFLVENGVLVARLVELGRARGNAVEILSGLSASDTFVIDVRGLTAGTEVEVAE